MSLRSTIRHSNYDSAWYSLMVGLGETYLAAFTLHIGLGDIHSGFISVAPVAIGSMIQLALTTLLMHKVSNRKWVLACAIGQALCLFALFVLPAISWESKITFLLYTVTTIYWTLGLAASSSWNAWMADLIPKKMHVRFFSNRSRISQGFVFLGIVAAGLSLKAASATDHVTLTFALIFFSAGFSRMISSYHIWKQPEENRVSTRTLHRPSTKTAVGAPPKSALLALIAYSFVLQCMVNIAAPYFNPYMLKILELDYVTYTFLVGTTFITRIVFFPYITRFAEVQGPYRLLAFGTILLGTAPLFWHLYEDLPILFLLQTISGIGWGLQDLGLLLLVFDRYGRKERSRVLVYLNFFNSVGMLLGAFVGSVLLQMDSLSKDGYHMVFVVSCMGRIASFLILPFLYHDVRHRRWVIFMRIVGLRPNMGVIFRPIMHIAKDKETEYSSEK